MEEGAGLIGREFALHYVCLNVLVKLKCVRMVTFARQLKYLRSMTKNTPNDSCAV